MGLPRSPWVRIGKPASLESASLLARAVLLARVVGVAALARVESVERERIEGRVIQFFFVVVGLAVSQHQQAAIAPLAVKS